MRGSLPISFRRVLASWNTLRYVAPKVAPSVTPTARSIAMNSYLFPPILTACLWAGVLITAWDNGWGGGDAFGVVAGSFIAALVLLLPAAFIAGLVWRFATWVWDTWIYRPRPP